MVENNCKSFIWEGANFQNIYKNSYNSIAKKKKKGIQLKDGQKVWTFFQKRYRDGQQVHEEILNIINDQENANENHDKMSPHLLERLFSKTQGMTIVARDVKKTEPLSIVVGNINWCSYYGKQYRSFLKT